MTAFATLQHALDARATSKEAVHYIGAEAAERRVDYAQLRARALRLLGHFQQRGVAAGAEMILLLDGNEPFVDAFWACILGRIAAVPLAPGNTDQHRYKFVRVVDKMREPWVITERKTFARVEAFARDSGLDTAMARIARRVFYVDDVTGDDIEGRIEAASADDIAFIQFSSGSTSAPKGVVLTHRNLASNIDAILAGIGGARDSDSSLSWMPLTHDMGLIGFHLVPLVAGASHWLMPTSLFVRRPALWMMKSAEHRVSVTCSPNFGYQHFLKAFDRNSASALDLSAVRVIFNGAEPIAIDLCREFLAALAPARLAPDVMLPVYGLAEASLAVTFPPMRRRIGCVRLARGALAIGEPARMLDATATDGVDHVKVGTPVAGCELRIADANGAAFADGTVGRLLIRGGNVTSRYYGDDALTASVIDAHGWLDTGDLGAIVDGEVVITGRAKEIIFAAGQNLYPHDLEELLARHAGIDAGRAAIAGVRAADGVTDEIVVFALHKGTDLATFRPIAMAARRALGEHAGVTLRDVVPVRQLPKTTSGKLQRFALADAYARGDYSAILAELAALSTVDDNAADDSVVERSLLEICQSLLPNRRLHADDNLFEIGTSSLALAQIYERVDAMWPGRLEVTDFFDYPTVRAMARYLQQRAEPPRA
ncbi:MAG: non-ribosomal peptide synthetase [Betaproteobacteria bacterium]